MDFKPDDKDVEDNLKWFGQYAGHSYAEHVVNEVSNAIRKHNKDNNDVKPLIYFHGLNDTFKWDISAYTISFGNVPKTDRGREISKNFPEYQNEIFESIKTKTAELKEAIKELIVARMTENIRMDKMAAQWTQHLNDRIYKDNNGYDGIGVVVIPSEPALIQPNTCLIGMTARDIKLETRSFRLFLNCNTDDHKGIYKKKVRRTYDAVRDAVNSVIPQTSAWTWDSSYTVPAVKGYKGILGNRYEDGTVLESRAFASEAVFKKYGEELAEKVSAAIGDTRRFMKQSRFFW